MLDEDVRRLQVAVDDPLLVRVLHGRANLLEQAKALLNAEPVRVAELGEGDALDEFHDEVRLAGVRGAGIEQLGDVGMIHQGDGLPFGLEPGKDRRRVAALDADQFDRDPALDRFGLVGHPDGAHSAFADLLKELVLAGDDSPRRLGRMVKSAGGPGFARRRLIQQRMGPGMGVEQLRKSFAKGGLAGALAVQQGGAFRRVGDGQGRRKQVQFVHVADLVNVPADQ